MPIESQGESMFIESLSKPELDNDQAGLANFVVFEFVISSSVVIMIRLSEIGFVLSLDVFESSAGIKESKKLLDSNRSIPPQDSRRKSVSIACSRFSLNSMSSSVLKRFRSSEVEI